MLIDTILERNRAHLRGRGPRPLPEPSPISLAIVACDEPRLDGLLEAALGLGEGQAIMLRVAGAVVGPAGDPIRSLALGAFLFGVTEVAVVGHTSCRMAGFESAPFIDAFRARGVPREAFGAADLRVWAGALRDPRHGIRSSVAVIAAAPFLPRDLAVAGLLLDDATGALEVVVKPGDAAAPEPAPAEASPERAAPPVTTAGPPPLEAPKAAERAGAAAAAGVDWAGTGDPAKDRARSASAIRLFLSRLEATSGWGESLARLRRDLAAERSTVARLGLLERFVRAAAADARDVGAAFRQLREHAAADRSGLSAEELIELFQRTVAKTKRRP